MIFSVPIFVIVFRETLEAGIIISVLLALVSQLVKGQIVAPPSSPRPSDASYDAIPANPASAGGTRSFDEGPTRTESDKALLRKLRIQIFAGAGAGLLIALAIGAAFLAVFYTQAQDLYSKSEDLWEAIFSLIACLMIYAMGITMLKMDHAKVKWRLKLQAAFQKSQHVQDAGNLSREDKKAGFRTRYALFLLPLITVLREGLETVIFVGGVSLGQEAKSIPLATIVGLLCGIVVGYLLYRSSSRLNMSIFLVGSTCLLLLIGAGLASKTVGYFQTYKYNQMVGGDVSETGSGPGSYSVHGNVWHLPYGNPEMQNGWSIFNAIFGWSNNASVGTILAYCTYWLAVIGALVYMKWREGRIPLSTRFQSAAGRRRAESKSRNDVAQSSPSLDDGSDLKKVGSVLGGDPTAATHELNVD